MTAIALHATPAWAVAASSWLLAGALLGAVNLLALRSNVQCLLDGRPWRAFGLKLLRFAATATALVVAVRWFGAPALLACTLGLTVARAGLLRWSVR
jgi:hypothetical protein